jgi:hypothetical protein
VVDHETIDEAIDDIELIIRHGDLHLLRRAARDFAELLEAHFAREEASPMFTTLARGDAALTALVERLLREHGEMRAEVRALLESDDMPARLLALFKRLDAHEKIEMDQAIWSITHD